MTRDWNEADEGGNPPGHVVGFSQWSFAEKALTDLGARLGETATEHDVAEYIAEDDDHIREVAEAVLADVDRREESWVRDQREYRVGFERRLRNAYGDGLDRLGAFVGLCSEAAIGLHERGEVGKTGEVLLDLHARACLAAMEVHALLSGGFPLGALAAWRTIHEAAVYAILLGDHGHDDEDRLTRRWLAFNDVVRYKDVKIYQQRAERIQHEPLTGDEMAAAKTASMAAISEWGKALADPNGWAGELTHPGPAHFDRLEELAGLGHLRGHYRWASHRVHADGRGNEMNVFQRGDQATRLLGPTNSSGFVDAADLTIGSVHVVTNSLLMRSRAGSPHVGELVVAELLGLMRDRVVAAFIEGQEIVTEAEHMIVENGATHPLEDVMAWWPRTTEEPLV